MLSPEVWDFKAPETRFTSTTVTATTGNITLPTKINTFYFNHLISLITPGGVKVPKEVLLGDSEYYKVTNITLDALVSKEFIANFGKKGDLTALSIDTRIDVDNCVCITPCGKIVLSLTKDSYESLGLQGTESHYTKNTKTRYGECAFELYDYFYEKPRAEPPLKMPRHCVVPRLESLCVSAVGNFVVSLAPHILSTIDKHKEPQMRLQKSVDRVSQILATHVPLYLYDGMALEVLEAVKANIERTKKNYYLYFNNGRFMTEMYVAVGLTEAVLDKHLKQISFSCWPKIMRYVLYKNLFKLTGLEVLNLGSCTNGSSDYEPYIVQGIHQMHNLRSLCLCFDCTDNIVQVLSESCPNLQILDVTSSRSVTDRSVPHLLKCTQLYELNLHRTSISIEGLAQVLIGLYRLQDVGRCDDFGEVLAHLGSRYPKMGPINLRKIHTRDLTTEQLRMLVHTCPNLENVSLFHDEQFSNLQVLSHLDHLKSLKLLSCDFYGDYTKQLLDVRGCNITSLHLEHVEQVDLKAIMDVSQCCPRLKNLVLYNCDLTDQAVGYGRSFKVKPFQCLERLFWVVDCALAHLEFVLMHCTSIKYIHLGSSTGICHSSIVKILGFNQMKELEELRILYSTDMSTNTVELLLASCTNLRVLSELENWQGITIDQLDEFRKFLHSNNYDLDIRPILSY